MPPKCNIPDQVCTNCGKSVYRTISQLKRARKHFCNKACHDAYQRKQGANVSDRLWTKVEKRGPTDCWPFTGGLGSQGRGIISLGGKNIYASKAAWIVTHGPVNDGVWVLHTCDNGRCCNPAHLFLGTPQDNSADMDSKGRRVTLRGEQDPKSILTDQKVRQIRQLYKPRQFSQFKLAAMFGVRRTTIQSVLNGSNWAHVK